MPRLSKLNLLPAVLSVATCLAVVPCIGRGQDNDSSKTNIAKSAKLPSLDPTLAPGNTFDAEIAAALLVKPISTNTWFKIPAWYSGAWQSDQRVVVFSRDEQSGAEDPTSHIGTWHGSGTHGTFTDKQFDVWQFMPCGVFTYNTGPDVVQCFWRLSFTQTINTDKQYSYQDVFILFTVDRRSKIIKLCTRFALDVNAYPISDSIMREKTIFRTYDWEGNPVITEQSVDNSKKIKDLQDQWATPEDKAKYPLFAQFLREHKMADRIPDAPPSVP